jgi:hypothetical protein
MELQERLKAYYDVSGECIVGIASSTTNLRPRLGRKGCKALGIPWTPMMQRDSLIRYAFFECNPTIDRNYSITLSCGDNRCVNVEHARLGVLNPPMKKNEA